jgi:putative ABC transport system permease protein
MLFRNVLRTLQARWIQLVILGIMIFLSSFLYTTMDYAIRGTLEPTESYFEEANQEDFAIELFDLLTQDDAAFILANCDLGAGMPTGDIPVTLSAVADINPPCYDLLLERRIDAIASTYDNIMLEVRRSKDLYFHQGDTSYRFRVVRDMETINLSYVIEGRRPQTDDELTVSEVFARKNNLSVGDTWQIGNDTYTISGFVLFPDYSLTLMGTELIIDNQTQSVVLMTDAAFDALDERTDATIAGVFEGDYTKEQFQEDVIEDFRNQDDLDFISLVVLTENNMRSGAIYAELEGGKGMTILLSLLIASIALMIVGVLVSRILEAQKGPIGIQKAMGYTNAEIARPYLFFLAILSLPIILLGYVAGLYMAEPFMMIYLDYYVLPYQEIQQVPEVALIAVILPFVFLLGLGYVIVLRLLRRSPVDLLSPEMTSETSRIGSKLGRLFGRLPVLAKLQQLLLFRNLIKFTVFLMGMFFAAYLIYFTFSMNGIFDRMLYDYYETTEHESIGYCTMGEDCLIPEDGEAVIELPPWSSMAKPRVCLRLIQRVPSIRS